MLPPRMVNVSSNRKIVEATANSAGIGYGNRASLPNAQAATGRVTTPSTATILKAIPYGSTTSSRTIKSAGGSM